MEAHENEALTLRKMNLVLQSRNYFFILGGRVKKILDLEFTQSSRIYFVIRIN
ncbi:hypothetical protein DZE40_004996 [Clostridium beijerinckii]|uniref:Uncharacterized protein n=1 Tax=Clostridium beijerinckii TaxID=1520 RepID=A0A1S8RNX7_CLOBE|nr:hypothetical protein [Clostridium beijerinckii]OOM54809.1 hypothetical protein CLBCK_46110 [Clostridium beijerinckii]